jgi:hypothetical protein
MSKKILTAYVILADVFITFASVSLSFGGTVKSSLSLYADGNIKTDTRSDWMCRRPRKLS